MVESIVSGSAAIYLDDTHFPVLISTWVGRADETTVRGFFAWGDRGIERARREGVRMVQITDATEAERPDPVTRKLLAHFTDAQSDEAAAMSLATIVVLDSAIIRGAMTAIGWLTRRKLDVIAVGDMASAIQRAREELTKAGQTPPAHLDPRQYLRPATKRASS